MPSSTPPRQTSVGKLITSRPVVWLAVMAGVFALVIQWSSMPQKQQPAIGYQAPGYQVWVELKPHDCDFFFAPLGNKHCRYEKVVDVERACDAPDCRVTVVREGWHKIELGTLNGHVLAISAEILPVGMAQGHLIPCEQPVTVAANPCEYFRQAMQAQLKRKQQSCLSSPYCECKVMPDCEYTAAQAAFVDTSTWMSVHHLRIVDFHTDEHGFFDVSSGTGSYIVYVTGRVGNHDCAWLSNGIRIGKTTTNVTLSLRNAVTYKPVIPIA